ncbi:MAG: DUF1659 domain-containing protein [Chitinophagaceae bacterium]
MVYSTGLDDAGQTIIKEQRFNRPA